MAKYPIPFGRHLLLLERINVGGMAEVFRAKSFGVEGFERIVAIKRILPTLVDDEEFITMFIDEARIAAQLTHQNIVQIYELGKHDDNYYISMEYIAGRDLRQMLDRQKKLGEPMEPMLAASIIARVCEALDYAHRKRDATGRDLGIIHRDVTPQNVIVSYEGEVKLCDFGIAKAATRVSKTQVGVLKGKFAYMAPEQVKGQPVDRRGDLFALGVIFFELLTHERLFLGDSDYATIEAIRSAPIPSPRVFRPEVSEGLEAVVMRLLARDPQVRYAWASEVHEDLQAEMVQAGRGGAARRLRSWMQQTYASEITAENAKMDRFMELRRPPAPAEALGDDTTMTNTIVPVPMRSDSGDATADFPALPSAVLDALHDKTAANEVVSPGGPADESPVASRFGPPRVAELAGEPGLADGESDMVRPAGPGDDDPDFAEEALHERTIFDSVVPADDGETVHGDEVRFDSTRAEIRDLLVPELDDAVADATTVGGDDTEFSAVQPALTDDEPSPAPRDQTRVQSQLPAATVESVFSVEEATPSEAQLTSEGTLDDGDGILAGSPPQRPDRPRAPSVPATPSRTRSMLRSAPVREVNANERVNGRGAPAGDGPSKPPPLPSRELPAAVPAAPSVGAARLVAPVDPGALSFSRPALLAGAIGVAVLFIAALVVLLQPRQASLQIESKPVDGAVVYVDGERVGATPIRVDDLDLGRHRVQIQAAGYLPYVQTIKLQAPRPHTMIVPLKLAEIEAIPVPPEPVPSTQPAAPSAAGSQGE